MDDILCPSEKNEYIYSEITVKEKYIRFEHGDHFMYSFDNTEGEIEKMVQTIETGTVDKNFTGTAALTWK